MKKEINIEAVETKRNEIISHIKNTHYDSALNSSRTLIEGICIHFLNTIPENERTDLYQRTMNKRPPSLEDFITLSRRTDTLPKSVEINIQVIRDFGNFGSHYQSKSKEEKNIKTINPCIYAVDHVVDWFLRECLHVEPYHRGIMDEVHLLTNPGQLAPSPEEQFEKLVTIALADGVLAPQEEEFLRATQQQLNIPEMTAQDILSRAKQATRHVTGDYPVVSNNPRWIPCHLGFTLQDIHIPFVRVSGGEFVMGEPLPNDPPLVQYPQSRKVEITTPFYLAAIPVTVQLWDQVMRGLKPTPKKPTLLPSWVSKQSQQIEQPPDQPKITISWFDAAQFCNELSKLMGLQPAYKITTPMIFGDVEVEWIPNSKGFRLPTEAEWERGCRMGLVGRALPSPAPLSSPQQLVASAYDFEPDKMGFRGMLGNVFEWCWDWYLEDTGSLRKKDPTGPPTGRERIARGGSHQSAAEELHPSFRGRFPPNEGHLVVGLRLARSL